MMKVVGLLLCGLFISLASCGPVWKSDELESLDQSQQSGEDIMATITNANEKLERLDQSQQSGEDIMETITNANENNDAYLFEGDIHLSSHDNVDQGSTDDVDSSLSDSISKKNALRSRLMLWKNKRVPYVIQVSDAFKPVIKAAMDEYHKNTCIRFVPRTNEDKWITFVNKSGCWSYVGMIYWKKGSQEISLATGCNHKGVIMHELLHALGFYHEQSRPDRNQYVEVFWENIKKGKEGNFKKYDHGKIDTLKATYDYQSIMHYGNKQFSKNGKPTLQGVGPNKGVTLGQRKGFTKTDIFEINALYDCSGMSNGWNSWSDYGPCDSGCNKVRQRFCSASDKSACPGADYYGVQTEKNKCPDSECHAPVNGHWGRWSSWSQCSVTCGVGPHTRTRKCEDPTPKNGGKSCTGDRKQTGQCSLKRCGLGPDDCEFEMDTCSWTQKNPSNPYRWYRHTGETNSKSTGPTGDVSLNHNGKGYYIYAEASNPAQTGNVAKLQSKVFSATKGRCIQFAYNMYGGRMGSLNVYVISVTSGAKSKPLFSKSGDQGQKWHKGEATIVSAGDYKISFEATRGSFWKADIALDDIMFKDGACGSRPSNPRGTTPRPATSRPSTTSSPTTSIPTTSKPTTARPTTARPTTARPTTARPTTSVNSLDCNFDKDLCKWWSLKGTNRYPWTRRSGSTPSANTGPSSDHTTGGAGSYVYMETSWQNGSGQVTYLLSPILPASGARCMRFYYHMYGATMGSLDVYIATAKTSAKLFTKSGNQGNVWHLGKVTITSTFPHQIVFIGVRGNNYLSDIALDDISFKDGACS